MTVWGKRPQWSRKKVSEEFIPVQRDLQGLKKALEAEKAAVQPIGLRLLEIRQEGSSGYYSLRVERESAKKLSQEQEGWIVAGRWNQEIHDFAWLGEVRVVDIEAATLIVFIEVYPEDPERSSEAFLHEPDFQRRMRQWLDQRIASNQGLPPLYQQLAEGSLSGASAPGGAFLDPALRPKQRQAVELLRNRLSVVWGPPGTGKTFTLGALGAALALAGLKLLVLAPTNNAADQAALALDDACQRLGHKFERGELIRPGRPSLAELDRRRHLMAWSEDLALLTGEILDLRKRVQTELRLQAGLAGDARLHAGLRLARLKVACEGALERRSMHLRALARNAKILVTTLNTGMDELILEAFSARPSALIFDEASMIPRFGLVPFLGLAPARIVLCGDPCQLGPIRRDPNQNDQNSKHWVAESAFDAIGAGEPEGRARLEQAGQMTLLEEQSRMQPEVCEPVSRVFYGGRLKAIGSPPLPPLAPGWPAAGCVLVDVMACPLPREAPAGVSRSPGDKSREYSAWIALGLALDLARKSSQHKMLLLTPFRNQANLFSKLLQAHLSYNPNVKAGTVHVSQGQEADLVIFDPVQPDHFWLRGGYGQEEIRRLFCVAFSRPRAQILVLASRSEIQANDLLARLCEKAEVWKP